MSLPKLEVPTYTIKLESIKDTVTYRPFLVKEEKILLMALEGGDGEDILKAVQSILTTCIMESKINIPSLPTFDLEYLFLNIRAKSVGEMSTVSIPCPECETQKQHDIPLEKIKLKTNKEHTNKVELSNTVGLYMKYPTISLLANIEEITSENSLDIISACVDSVYDGEKEYDFRDYSSEERQDFLDNLTQAQLLNIQKFFETMPSLEHDINYKCKNEECNHESTIPVRGLQNFFS